MKVFRLSLWVNPHDRCGPTLTVRTCRGYGFVIGLVEAVTAVTARSRSRSMKY